MLKPPLKFYHEINKIFVIHKILKKMILTNLLFSKRHFCPLSFGILPTHIHITHHRAHTKNRYYSAYFDFVYFALLLKFFLIISSFRRHVMFAHCFRDYCAHVYVFSATSFVEHDVSKLHVQQIRIY